MIVYDGVTLNSIAEVKIEDVRVDSIKYDEVTRPRAITGGSVFVRSRAGTRTIAVTFALLDDDKIRRQKALLAISEWAKNDKEYRLELPGHPDHFLMAICTDKPDPSLRQWWESKLRLVFTCYDNPYWNSKGEKSAVCGNNFTVLGDAPPLMRIERTLTSEATNQSYSFGGRTMTFSSIPAGKMTIDLNRQTAVTTNANVVLIRNYNITSRFIVPVTGSMNISGTGTVFYRERWQ